jgi:hypothetical protein
MTTVLLMLLLVVCLGIGILTLLVVGTPTRKTAVVSQSQPTVIAYAPITIGVIMTEPASRYGWEGVAASRADYLDMTINGSRAILFDNLNAAARPGVTLDQVVGGMVERGARYLFISSAHVTGANEVKVDEQYPNTVFIMNLSTRADVEALLNSLALTQSDADRLSAPLAANPAAPASQPQTASGTGASGASTSLRLVVVLVLVIGGPLLYAFLTARYKEAVIAWKARQAARGNAGWAATPATHGTARRSTTVLERMLESISAIGQQDKPKKKRVPASVHARGLAIQDAAERQMTDFASLGEPDPVVHRLTTYVMGDTHYDESFSIELSSGDFVGECGLGIAAPVNRYDPSRVTAFELWLFDKSDIRTVTTFLLSQHALDDAALRSRWQSKGELVLAEPDGVTVMETRTLRLRARVLDMQYGFSDTFPQASFFDYLVLEIAVWQR